MAKHRHETRTLERRIREVLTVGVPPLLRGAAGALGALAPAMAWANPSGGQVVAGSATINAPSANGLVINQSTQNAVINWQQFSVGQNQYVQFVQPSSSSVVLNRVVGGTPSQIFGDITANGQVFLVNPNGIFFAPGSTLDVQGIVATTMDIKDSDFMSGRYVFSKAPGAPDASVVNQGAIVTGPNGYVVLAGDYVENDGQINAQLGRVVLAASGAATLTLQNSQLISYVVDGATLARLAGVDNTGAIVANGGAVLMTADVANALTATAVNNSGFVAAHAVQAANGVIELTAKGGGIENSGTLDASAIQAGVAGGDIIIRDDGHTQISAGAVVEAQGDQASGGFIELSGHTLTVKGKVDSGRGGNLLIDPSTLTIVTGSSGPVGTAGPVTVGSAYIAGLLNAGQNVTLVASNSIGHASNVTALTATGGAGNLTVKTGTLAVGAGGSLGPSGLGCLIQGVCQPGSLITFTPTSGSINFNGMTITIKGAFIADADHGAVNLGKVTANGGITLNGWQINVGSSAAPGSLTATAGNVVITGATAPGGPAAINVFGPITAHAVTISENFPASASYGGHIKVTGAIKATTGSIDIAAVTTANQSMGISVGSLSAAKGVNLQLEGHAGLLRFGKVTAGSSSGTIHAHAGLYISAVLVGPSASGGNVSNGNASITATGGVQINTNVVATNGRGGDVFLGNIQGKYISINAHGRHSGGSVNVGSLHATGTASNDGISVTASDSPGWNGANIKVGTSHGGSGGIKADHGGVSLTAQGGSDSGGKILVRGGISAAGLVNILAVNEGCCSGSVVINSGGVKGKFIDIATRATQASNHTGARVVIHGNVTATGTATASSTNVGVNIHAGSSGAPNGGASIQIDGNVTASHGVVNLSVYGNNGGRTITVGSAGSGGWVNGQVKGQRVDIRTAGFGTGGAIDVGAVTTLGSGFRGDASIVASGTGGSGHVNVHGPMNISGTFLRVSTFGPGGKHSVSISGAVHASNAGVSIGASVGGSGSFGAKANVGSITAKSVSVFATGRGAGGAAVNVSGNVIANGSIDLSARNNHGGSAVISAGKLTAPDVTVNAFAIAASGQAAHITVGSISAVNTTGKATVDINAGGKANTVALGAVTVSGHAALASVCEGICPPHPVGGQFEVITHGGSSDAITINGSVKVTALADTANSLGDAVVEIASFKGSASTAAVANTKATINGKITVNAAQDAHLLIHGSASGALSVKAGRNIDDSAPTTEVFGVQPKLVLSASAVALQASNAINLTGASLSIGSGVAPGVAGDHAVTKFLGLGSINPNAAFIAGGAINLGKLTGTAGYVLIEAGAVGTLGTVSLGSGALVQLTVSSPTGTVGVGNGAGNAVYTAAYINKFAGDTVVIGDSTLTGTMTVGTANLGSTSVTLVDKGAINGTGVLTAGHLDILAGAGVVSLTTNVATTDIVSGANVKVNDSAFAGNASLSIASAGVGSVSYDFGGGTATLATNVKITGGLTLKSKGTLDLTSDSIHAGGAVNLAANKHILLGKTAIAAGGALSADAQGSISDGGSGGVISAVGGATFKAATGNIVLDGATLNTGAATLAFSAAGSISLNGAMVHAGSMTVAGASNLNMTGASVHAATLTIITGGSIDLSSDNITVTGLTRLTAGFVGSGTTLAAKDIVLSGITLTTGTLEASAGGTIHNGGGPGTITANGLAVIAGQDINLSSTQLNIGTGTVAGVSGDVALLVGLADAGIAPLSTKPNGTFIAGSNLTLGNVNLTGSYLYLQAANISALGKITVPAGTLVQASPIDPTATMGFEDQPATNADFNLSNQGFMNQVVVLNGGSFTLALGNSAETGDATLGQNGTIDIGSNNLIVDTSGNVTGLENVISTGIVASLSSLLGPPVPPPTAGEIDPTSTNNNNTAGGNDKKRQGEGGEDTGAGGVPGGTITQDIGNASVCH
ncbi:MAG: filamentous hemagglutinin N-terminal domain-containing protein [Bacillota bacterium]